MDLEDEAKSDEEEEEEEVGVVTSYPKIKYQLSLHFLLRSVGRIWSMFFADDFLSVWLTNGLHVVLCISKQVPSLYLQTAGQKKKM